MSQSASKRVAVALAGVLSETLAHAAFAPDFGVNQP